VLKIDFGGGSIPIENSPKEHTSQGGEVFSAKEAIEGRRGERMGGMMVYPKLNSSAKVFLVLYGKKHQEGRNTRRKRRKTPKESRQTF